MILLDTTTIQTEMGQLAGTTGQRLLEAAEIMVPEGVAILYRGGMIQEVFHLWISVETKPLDALITGDMSRLVSDNYSILGYIRAHVVTR